MLETFLKGLLEWITFWGIVPCFLKKIRLQRRPYQPWLWTLIWTSCCWSDDDDVLRKKNPFQKFHSPHDQCHDISPLKVSVPSPFLSPSLKLKSLEQCSFSLSFPIWVWPQWVQIQKQGAHRVVKDKTPWKPHKENNNGSFRSKGFRRTKGPYLIHRLHSFS